MRTHSLKTCSLCGKSAKNLSDHVNNFHTKNRITCDFPNCTTTFVREATKKIHVNNVHLKKKNECIHCGKKIIYLKRHLKSCLN